MIVDILIIIIAIGAICVVLVTIGAPIEFIIRFSNSRKEKRIRALLSKPDWK